MTGKVTFDCSHEELWDEIVRLRKRLQALEKSMPWVTDDRFTADEAIYHRKKSIIDRWLEDH